MMLRSSLSLFAMGLFLAVPVQGQRVDITPACCRVDVAERGEGAKACCRGEQEKPCCNLETAQATVNAQTGGRGGHDGRGGARGGRGGQHGHVQGRGGGRGAGPQALMQDVRTLIWNHGSITRKVEEIPNGVKTTTTTTDPKMVATLRKHPKEMAEHLKEGGMVRHWDPLFVELAKHAKKVDMKFKDIENGIEVISTSKDEEVVKLIRAHAKKVSEFVARGRGAMHEATPLPEGYRSPETK